MRISKSSTTIGTAMNVKLAHFITIQPQQPVILALLRLFWRGLAA
jgi:hypothetical protein